MPSARLILRHDEGLRTASLLIRGLRGFTQGTADAVVESTVKSSRFKAYFAPQTSSATSTTNANFRH
jgi:hypothetical protein